MFHLLLLILFFLKEIPVSEAPVDPLSGCTYYLTLINNGLQIKQGDTVYLDRIKSQVDANQINQDQKSTENTGKSEVDVFRVERLYIDPDGNKLIYGHHYLRPSETFHEPSRKFFPNELLRSPISGIAPLEAVKGICYVMDLSTYCKGRPKGAKEEDVFVCEFRIDKYAKSFEKIRKIQYSICLKNFAFNFFERRYNPKRTCFVSFTLISTVGVI